MGWSGSLSASSAVGSTITYTPDTTSVHSYTVGTFTAPKKGVYQFVLKGSGGDYNGYHNDGVSADGGVGGYTVGYLVLEANQTIYVGAGGTCSAAFVSKTTGTALKNIAKSSLYFVAGAGGGGGARWGEPYNMKASPGGAGGGASGETAIDGYGGIGAGTGGSQTSGYAYGEGGIGGYGNDGASYHRGDGGDGLYGGYAGEFSAGMAQGGGGGSGYVYSASLTVGSKTYTSMTTQGGGAGSGTVGSVAVTFYANAELPVTFDGVKLMEVFFNGTKVEHLVYNGTAVFMHKLKQETAALAEWIAALRGPKNQIREAFA